MMNRKLVVAALAGVVGVGLCVRGGGAAEQPAGATPTTKAAPTSRPGGGGGGEGGGMAQMGMQMVQALRGVEGCLGAEAGQFSGRRFVIIAWFKDKKSAMRWVNHPMHMGLQAASGHAREADEESMVGVPDGVPVMALAAIGFDGPPATPGSRIPFSSISIEIYSGAKNSLKVGKGFAPTEFFEGATTKPADGK